MNYNYYLKKKTTGYQQFLRILLFLGYFLTLVHILEKAMAPHSSTPAGKIPWVEEPGRLQYMGS